MKMKITIDRNIDTIPTDYSWQFGLAMTMPFNCIVPMCANMSSLRMMS